MERCSTFNVDLSENVAYNDPSFPAYITRGFLSFYPDLRGCTHWHEDWEFIVVVSGAEVYNVNGNLIRLEEGDAIFVNSRQIHYGFSEDGKDCEFVCILLNPSLLCANKTFDEKFVKPFVYNINCPFIKLSKKIPWQKKAVKLLMEIYARKDSGTWQFVVQRNFFSLFELIYSNADVSIEVPAKNSSGLNALKLMMVFIQDNYKKKILLDDIASAGFCCKSKCSSLFTQYLKESPITYLIKYRLKISTELLCKTDIPITEIAYECGFSGTSYFCEMFHRYYQTTALEFRKNSSVC
ncbi:AraC family transcriptional regulator [Treponema sp.]|uniref:AraC family transcriptional regulator n=1 Tax=Treponema sp. TaxID=166 RepID=UPI003F057721